MSAHRCHAHGCQVPVPPKMFMCRPHWRRLPMRLQRAIWVEYRSGQEIDKIASVRYMAVQQHAIGVLAFKPNDEAAAAAAAPYLLNAEWYRQQSMKAGSGDPLPWLPHHPEVPSLPWPVTS